MFVLEILSWLVIGFAAAGLEKLVSKRPLPWLRVRAGCVVGATVGGVLGRVADMHVATGGFSVPALVAATAGTILGAIAVWSSERGLEA